MKCGDCHRPVGRVGWMMTLAVVALGLVESGLGTLQLLGIEPSRHHLYPITGTFYNPGPFGCFVAVAVPMAVWGALSMRRCFPKVLCYAMVVLACLTLPASMSRTAWLACAVGMGYVAVASGRVAGAWRINFMCSKGRVGKLLFALLALALLAGVVWGLYQLKATSANGRLLMWKIGAMAMERAPLTGVGWDCVAGAYGDAQEAYFAAGGGSVAERLAAGSPEYVFNEYLQLGIAFGLPALVALVALLVLGVVVGHRGGLYGAVGSLLAFAVVAMASYPLQFNVSVAQAVLVVCCCLVPLLGYGRVGRMAWAFVASALVGLAVWAGAVRLQREQAEDEWKAFQPLYNAKAYATALPRYETLHDRMAWNARYLFEHGYCLHKTGRYAESNAVLAEATRHSSDPMILDIMGKNYQAMGCCGHAEAMFDRAANRQPNLLYPLYLKLLLHEAKGDSVAMALDAAAVERFQVKVASPATRDMKAKADSVLRRFNM